ncbi:hypothetical protein K9N50_04225 [bacterium]|nr:hypothetical protein [bacterium]
MIKAKFIILAAIALSFLSTTAFSQDDDLVMLEEIRITVEPEMPNVFVTIPRQNPTINVGELKRPEESKLFGEPLAVKPKLSDIEVSKVEKAKKMLAKDRNQ